MRVLLLVLAAVAGMACAPRGRDVRLERLAAERRSLEATLDHLEDRLLVNQSRVRFWQEMRSRHESVSAVACASLEEHAEEMASRSLPSSLHTARVATAAPARAQARTPAAAETRVRN